MFMPFAYFSLSLDPHFFSRLLPIYAQCRHCLCPSLEWGQLVGRLPSRGSMQRVGTTAATTKLRRPCWWGPTSWDKKIKWLVDSRGTKLGIIEACMHTHFLTRYIDHVWFLWQPVIKKSTNINNIVLHIHDEFSVLHGLADLTRWSIEGACI